MYQKVLGHRVTINPIKFRKVWPAATRIPNAFRLFAIVNQPG
jgi:hypothetical protein